MLMNVSLYAQTATRAHIESKLREIYQKANAPVFVLTRENPLSVAGAVGSEITGTRIDGRFARIVAAVWSERGKTGAEYFFDGQSLIFVFEAQEFFEDVPGAWKNFKGISGWERRTYLHEGKVIDSERKGTSEPPADLQKKAAELLRILNARI